MSFARALYCFLFACFFLSPVAGAQTSVQIHDIMVAGTNPVAGTAATRTLPYSPYYGTTVSVSGIVVGVELTGDYAGTVYISEPSSSWDSLVLTAEGMPIFKLAALNSQCAVVGNTVTVVGPVVLSTAIVPADVTAAGTPGTGVNPTSCTVTSTGGTMTQSISVNGVLASFGDALKYTGMTTSATFYAVAPAGGTTDVTSGTVTSTGQFWATLTTNTATNSHLFRSIGIAGDEYVPASSTAPTWAGNPQRVLIDTTTFGGSPVDITVGQTISCVTGTGIKVGATAGIGLIDYTLGYARLLIFPTSTCTVGGTGATTNSAAADSTHFKVGTLDLNAFTASAPRFSTRLTKAANAIVTNLGTPDILSLQEVSDLATLSTLASSVNTLGSTSYVPYLIAGAGSTNVGFLVKSSTLTTDSVAVAPGAAGATYTTSAGSAAMLWDAPPLVLKAEFVRVGRNYPVTVINALLTPRDNSGDPTLGANIRMRRAAQASALSQLAQSYQTAGQNVVVAGNLNAFEFNDGYVDVTGIIDGTPATAVSTYQATSTTAALTDFNTQVTATSRYNFIERGDAVTYEHILASATVPDPNTASASLASYATSVTQPHFTTDYAATSANTVVTANPAAGLGPHDGFVVAFLIPPVPTTASITPASIDFGSVDLGASSAPMTATVTNTTTFISTVNITKVTISGTNPADFTETSNCTSLTEGSSCTVTLTFSPTALGARSAVLTVTDDSTSDPTLVVNLAGTGIDTTATLTPAATTFPSTSIGATSAATTFTFTNTSTVAETVSSATVTGDYAVSGNTCTSSVAASDTCTILVTFSPTVAGTRTGTLTVKDSSTGNATLTAALTGNGLDTSATLTPTTANFGSIYAGGGLSAAKIFTVTNTSAIAISIKTVAVAGNFTDTTTCGTNLAAGATCTVSVIFAPLNAGVLSGTLTVTDGSSADPMLTATLTGTGLPTTATLTPATAAYGNVIVGSTSSVQGFIWTNTSAIPLTISKVSTTGNFAVSASTCSGSVPAGGFCVVSVTFTPAALGALTGTVTVTSSASANPTLSSTLSGRGVADVQADVSSLDFGNIDIGYTSATQTFNITNYTTAAIAFTGISITGDYAYTTTCGSTLGALGNCTVAVSFTPTAVGSRPGLITVTTNDTKYPIITVALAGNGVDFAITVNPTSGSTIAGYSETPNLILTPLGGFASQIALGCATTAAGSTCTPQTTPYTLAATTTMPMTITTTSQYTVIGYSGFGAKTWMCLLAILSTGTLLVRGRRGKTLPRLAATVLLLVVMGIANLGCGSQDPAKNATPTLPGTYTYTVTATDGKLSHTATYTLTVSTRY